MAFSSETYAFLADLAQNNDREWFNANKKRYERHVRDASFEFIRAFEPHLHAISPHFEAIAKSQGGSLFRIYRDTRFSKDKTPYKTNAGLHFRHARGRESAHAPGFYLGIAPGDNGAGAGMWHPDNAALKRVRDRIVAEPDRWAAAKAHALDAGLHFMGDSLKRPPRGYPTDHPHIDDLMRKDLAVIRKLDDADIVADDALDRFVAICQAAAPVVEFLCDATGVEF